MHYDKWERFENFLKFAERKEIKDRLKELEPPPVSNYIDPTTVDNITKHRSKPPKIPKTTKNQDDNVAKANKERIQKMKEMYSMFV